MPKVISKQSVPKTRTASQKSSALKPDKNGALAKKAAMNGKPKLKSGKQPGKTARKKITGVAKKLKAGKQVVKSKAKGRITGRK